MAEMTEACWAQIDGGKLCSRVGHYRVSVYGDFVPLCHQHRRMAMNDGCWIYLRSRNTAEWVQSGIVRKVVGDAQREGKPENGGQRT